MINAYYIKTVLMEYWRFDRQCLCADEVDYGAFKADILVLTKSNFVHEIEIKISKSDLCIAELNKSKHKLWNNHYPNYFSFAVPRFLLEDAKNVIQKLNPNYGLILINVPENGTFINGITFEKSAKRIHSYKEKVEWWKDRIIYRNCSALISYMKRTHKNDQS